MSDLTLPPPSSQRVDGDFVVTEYNPQTAPKSDLVLRYWREKSSEKWRKLFPEPGKD